MITNIWMLNRIELQLFECSIKLNYNFLNAQLNWTTIVRMINRIELQLFNCSIELSYKYLNAQLNWTTIVKMFNQIEDKNNNSSKLNVHKVWQIFSLSDSVKSILLFCLEGNIFTSRRRVREWGWLDEDRMKL